MEEVMLMIHHPSFLPLLELRAKTFGMVLLSWEVLDIYTFTETRCTKCSFALNSVTKDVGYDNMHFSSHLVGGTQQVECSLLAIALQ